MSYEFVRSGKPMLGRTYYLQVDPRTIYALRFTGLRDKLSQYDFGSANFGLKDGNFNSHLTNAKPSGIPFDPDA